MSRLNYAGVVASIMRYCSDLALELSIESNHVFNYDSLGDMSSLGDGDTCGFHGLTISPVEGTTQFYLNVRLGFTTTANDNHHTLELKYISALMDKMVPTGRIPLYDTQTYQVIGTLSSTGDWATLPAESSNGISFKMVQFHFLSDCLLNGSAQSLNNIG